MPKMKTKKTAAKRFKLTGSGQHKRKQAIVNTSHTESTNNVASA